MYLREIYKRDCWKDNRKKRQTNKRRQEWIPHSVIYGRQHVTANLIVFIAKRFPL